MICHGQKISIIPKIPPNWEADWSFQEVAAIQTTTSIFQINNAKLYVPVVTFSINDNINFLENIKQGFKRTISLDKYKYEITTQTKTNNVDYLIDPMFRNINRLFVLSFKYGNDDTTGGSFDKYYMALVEKTLMH